MRYFAIALCALYATSALALDEPRRYAPPVNPKWIVVSEPPAEFDKPFPGMDIMIYDNELELAKDCRAPTRFGCMLYTNGRQCIVKLLRADLIREYGLDPDVVFRHERAHCHGFPASHIGAIERLIRN